MQLSSAILNLRSGEILSITLLPLPYHKDCFFLGLPNTAGGLGRLWVPNGGLRGQSSLKWLQNCFAGLENKSASQNLKVNLELYLGTSRSNNDKF